MKIREHQNQKIIFIDTVKIKKRQIRIIKIKNPFFFWCNDLIITVFWHTLVRCAILSLRLHKNILA